MSGKPGSKIPPVIVGKGMANTFRFKDWTDYTCDSGQGFFQDTEDSPPLKQMVKRYTFYGIDGTAYTHDRVISKPIEGKITTDATALDYATGIADSGSTWSGEFDCWARMNNDALKGMILTPKPGGYLLTFDGLEIVEVSHEEAEDLS